VDIIDLVKSVANQMKTEPAWFDQIVSASFHFVRKNFLTVISQPHSHAFTQPFHSQRDELIVAQAIRVTDDVRARFVHAEHHQQPFLFREWIAVKEIAHTFPQQRQVRSVTAEFDFRFLHRSTRKREQISGDDSRVTRIVSVRMCGRTAKSPWTPAESVVQFSCMWRVCVGLLLLATPVWADENATAYEALRVVGREFGRDAVHQIVSITGTKGDPQPEKWKIIMEDPQGRGLRELDVADGKIDSDDTADRDVAGSSEGATIDVSRLNLDSSGAFAVASQTADASHTNFATADYTLRTDDRGEPMWIVTLRSRSSRPVGTIYIGATRGTVRRTEGMFAGATMEDVQNDGDSDEEHGPFSGVKKQIKHAFHRTQDEARDMFERVKQSFSDFMNRE
jgi:hypothetical protein